MYLELFLWSLLIGSSRHVFGVPALRAAKKDYFADTSDSMAMEYLDRLYVTTEKQIQERTAAIRYRS